MPNRQKHRGQHANDGRLFHEKWLPTLQEAVKDLSFLFTRKYSEKSALKIVGDRYKLNVRQRLAVLRASCAKSSLLHRQAQCVQAPLLKDNTVWIDAYNLLIGVESMLSDGIILHCVDGCYRDIASVHGTYRKVEETLPALEIIGKSLEALQVKQAVWYLDAPVSNSGRLRGLLLNQSQEAGWNWEAHLVNNPDKTLVESEEIVISSDSWVLDHAKAWFNLNAYIIEHYIPQANVKWLDAGIK